MKSPWEGMIEICSKAEILHHKILELAKQPVKEEPNKKVQSSAEQGAADAGRDCESVAASTEKP